MADSKTVIVEKEAVDVTTTKVEEPKVNDNGKSRALEAIGGFAQPTYLPETVELHAFGVKAADLDRCKQVTLPHEGGGVSSLGALAATKRIKKGQLVTMIRPLFLAYYNKPGVVYGLERLGAGTPQYTSKHEKCIEAVKASVFHTQPIGQGAAVIGFTADQGGNPAYLGDFANEASMLPTIIELVNDFIKSHTQIGKSKDDGREFKFVLASDEEYFDLCVAYAHYAAQAGVNATIAQYNGICVPTIVAIRDIAIGETIVVTRGVGYWIGHAMNNGADGFSLNAMSQVAEALKKLEREEGFMGRVEAAVHERHRVYLERQKPVASAPRVIALED